MNQIKGIQGLGLRKSKLEKYECDEFCIGFEILILFFYLVFYVKFCFNVSISDSLTIFPKPLFKFSLSCPLIFYIYSRIDSIPIITRNMIEVLKISCVYLFGLFVVHFFYSFFLLQSDSKKIPKIEMIFKNNIQSNLSVPKVKNIAILFLFYISNHFVTLSIYIVYIMKIQIDCMNKIMNPS